MNDQIQEIRNRWKDALNTLPSHDVGYLLSEVERLQEENKVMKEALEWTRKRFDEEWTYELGTGEIVDEILTKFDSALFRLKDKT